jgi:hypothetical protein
MLKNKTPLRSLALTMALTATSLCAVAQIVEPPRTAHVAVRAALVGTTVTPKATIAAAMVKDVDQPARAPFQVMIPVNINNFVYTPVPIPAGQRLVIEFVSISGAAQSSSGPVQPIALLAATVAGNPSAVYYIGPTPAVALPTQYYHNEPVTIYADSLEVGPAFSGYTPSFMALNIIISGHLIAIP